MVSESSSSEPQLNEPIPSGYWLISNYRDPKNLSLPRRVNHATATYKNKIYLLGGYHKLDPHLDYDSLPSKLMSLDCYEFDCFTQKCVVRKKCEALTNSDMIFRSKASSSVNNEMVDTSMNSSMESSSQSEFDSDLSYTVNSSSTSQGNSNRPINVNDFNPNNLNVTVPNGIVPNFTDALMSGTNNSNVTANTNRSTTYNMDKDDCYPRELPLLRYGLRACAMNDKIYISGGISDYNRAKESSSLVNFADVFELDLKTWKYKNLTKMTPKELIEELNYPEEEEFEIDSHINDRNNRDVGKRQSPGVRDGHSLAEVPHLSSFLIFGGYAYTSEDLQNDLWLFDTQEAKWHVLDVRHEITNFENDHIVNFCNKLPFPRDFSDIQVVGNDLVMYGGRTYSYDQSLHKWKDVYDSDIWVVKDLFKPSTIQEIVDNAPNLRWERASPKENEDMLFEVPTPRRSQMTFVRNHEFYVIGGVDENKHHHPEIWKFSLKSCLWQQVKRLSRKIPRSRRRGSTIYLPGLDWLVMVCGTRPAIEKERQFMREKQKETSPDEDGECLMEVDDLNIFAFGDTLKNKALNQIMQQIKLNNYDCFDKLIEYSNIWETKGNFDDDTSLRTLRKIKPGSVESLHHTKRAIEVKEEMQACGLSMLARNQFYKLTAASQRSDVEEINKDKSAELTPLVGRAGKKTANG